MIRFDCDYTEGAHEAIMQRMIETNMEQVSGTWYGSGLQIPFREGI